MKAEEKYVAGFIIQSDYKETFSWKVIFLFVKIVLNEFHYIS